MKTLRFATRFAAFAAINSLSPATADPLESGFAGPPAQRRTSLSLATVKPNTPLQAAGLIGPVILQKIRSVP